MVAGNGGNDQVLTSVSLRSTARQLGRCSAELSALGPPTAQLRGGGRLRYRAAGLNRTAPAAAGASGSSTSNFEPWPNVLCTRTEPP
jgi:hypothetical protein